MSRISNLKDYGIDVETDPKLKFNSLISITVSTVMCLAARCPVPKPNVETTKLFLRTITDDQGKPPRNIKGLLNLLNHYSGPYECDSIQGTCFENSTIEQLEILEMKPIEDDEVSQISSRALEVVNELSLPSESNQPSVKKNGKLTAKKIEKKGNKNSGLKVSPSKSTITSKTF